MISFVSHRALQDEVYAETDRGYAIINLLGEIYVGEGRFATLQEMKEQDLRASIFNKRLSASFQSNSGLDKEMTARCGLVSVPAEGDYKAFLEDVRAEGALCSGFFNTMFNGFISTTKGFDVLQITAARHKRELN